MKHRPADILCHRDGVTYFLRFEDTELGALAKEVAEKALDTGRHRWLNDDTLSLDASAYQAVDEALDIVKRLKRKEVR